MRNEDIELTGLPESLGTTKCLYCQTEDTDGIEVFVDWYGEIKSVPCCEKCLKEIHLKGNGGSGIGQAPE